MDDVRVENLVGEDIISVKIKILPTGKVKRVAKTRKIRRIGDLTLSAGSLLAIAGSSSREI